MNDLKFTFRHLLKNPGDTALTVLTLALGLGANTIHEARGEDWPLQAAATLLLVGLLSSSETQRPPNVERRLSPAH